MEILYRYTGVNIFDRSMMFAEYAVLKRTPNGVWITSIYGGSWKKFFYTNKPGWKWDRHVFARPTKELAYKDYLSRVEYKLSQARHELSFWQEEQKRISEVDWKGKPHVLFLPTPEQTARTAYAIKMRLAVEHEYRIQNTFGSQFDTLRYAKYVAASVRVFVKRGV